MPEPAPVAHDWSAEAEDLIRAASGGMLVGVPLLYTMEMWTIGGSVSPLRMLVVLAVISLPVFLLNRTSGFRTTEDVRLIDAAMDTADALAVALVCVTVVLVLLREITWQTPLNQALGNVVYQTGPFALGIGLASHFLRDRGDGDEGDSSDGRLNATVADLGGTIMGAVFVAMAIAPTDEVPTLASAMSPRWLLTIVAASLVISYAIAFEAGFTNEKRRHAQQGLFQTPFAETVVSYLVALVTAAAMLWFFHRTGTGEPWQLTLNQTIVLGLPAAVGGAAGRLAI